MQYGHQIRTTKTKRKCLRCTATFRSSGPGNRLCKNCNAYADRVSPFLCEGFGTVRDALASFAEYRV